MIGDMWSGFSAVAFLLVCVLIFGLWPTLLVLLILLVAGFGLRLSR